MKCIRCGHTMEPEAPRTVDAELRGLQLSVTVVAPQCPSCGRVAISGKTARAYHRAVSDAYRRKTGLLTTDDINRLRRDLAMTWHEFSEYVFVGIATLKRWMQGEIQSQALDRLVRLRSDLPFLEQTASELVVRLSAVGADQCVTALQPRPRKKVRWAGRASATQSAPAA